MAISLGTCLGPYELLAPIGAGGMGEVYRARDTRLGRLVAIKILDSERAKSLEDRARFDREAKIIAALAHPNICRLYDVGRDHELDFLVMEFLEGDTLAGRLAKGPLSLDIVLTYAIHIAEALGYAHRRGVHHRDLKPSNIMLTKSGIKLLDFGLAILRPQALSDDGTAHTFSHLTAPGTILGTLEYMAPEQIEGADVDARADLFAFGVILYEMIAGRRPFMGATRAELITAILTCSPSPLSSVANVCPPTLDRIVKICLAKNPEERWSHAHDLMLLLRDFVCNEQSGTASQDTRLRRSFDLGYPPPIDKALTEQLLLRHFYKSDVEFSIRVSAVDDSFALFETELSYHVTNRTASPHHWHIGKSLRFPTSLVEVFCNGAKRDVESPGNRDGRGVRIPCLLEPGETSAVLIRVHERVRIPDSDLYTSYYPATDLRVRVIFPEELIIFDVELLYFMKVQPTRETGVIDIVLNRGILPYQGLRLNWKRRTQ